MNMNLITAPFKVHSCKNCIQPASVTSTNAFALHIQTASTERQSKVESNCLLAYGKKMDDQQWMFAYTGISWKLTKYECFKTSSGRMFLENLEGQLNISLLK